MVKEFQRLALGEGAGEERRRHVGSTPRAVHGEEAQAGDIEAVGAGVAVREQLVGFFGGAVKGRGLVGVGVLAEGRGRAGAVDGAAGGVNEVFRAAAAAGFEHAGEADEVAVRVGAGVFQAIAYAGLGAEVGDVVGFKVRDERGEFLGVGEIRLQKTEIRQRRELLKAGALEGDVIVVGEVVHAEHLATLRFGEAASDMVSDEAGGAGHEHFHSVER